MTDKEENINNNFNHAENQISERSLHKCIFTNCLNKLNRFNQTIENKQILFKCCIECGSIQTNSNVIFLTFNLLLKQ